MQVHYFPRAITPEPDVGLMELLVGDVSLCGASLDPQQVTRNRRVSARVDLHMQIGELGGFDSSTTLDERGPHLLVLWKVGAPLRKPLREIGRVVGEISRKIVGSVG